MFVVAGLLALLLGFAAWALRTSERERKRSIEILDSLLASPSDVVEIHFSTNDPNELSVVMSDQTTSRLQGLMNADCLLAFRRLEKAAPHARVRIFQNGREVDTRVVAP